MGSDWKAHQDRNRGPGFAGGDFHDQAIELREYSQTGRSASEQPSFDNRTGAYGHRLDCHFGRLQIHSYQRAPRANALDETAEAIRDLQKSHRQAADQLGMLQQTVSSNRAEMKRLSDEVTALTGKIEALQRSFTSAQQVPSVQPTEPPRQKRETGPRTR